VRVTSKPLLNGLTRRAGASLHHQLFAVLQSGIFSGRYRTGALLPSEDSLAETYQVSRATVRRAMQTLEARGMIERTPGIGTRVLAAAGDRPAVSTIVDLVGTDVSTSELSTLKYEFITAPPEVASQLALPAGSTVLHIMRLRLANGVPVRLTQHYLPELLGARLTPEMLEGKLVLRALGTIGVVAHNSRNIIGAILAAAEDAAVLEVDIGVPLLEMTRVSRLKTGTIILFQHSLTSPDREKLSIETDDQGGLSR
jgi:GntR family transcriptional regulator